jgi:transposase
MDLGQFKPWEGPAVTQVVSKEQDRILVAIDIAKKRNDVAVEQPDGSRRRFVVANSLADYRQFAKYLKDLGQPCRIGFEATGDYHRPLAYFLHSQGFELRLISSLAAARTREAVYNSRDKNDPKDAQVILHMLRTGVSQIYCDPVVHGFNDIQELSKTHYQVSRRKVQVQHSIINHYLPLYFPEAQKYFYSSRSEWLSGMLRVFPCPVAVTKHTEAEFIEAAWDQAGRKVHKTNLLRDFYRTATESIGIPVPETSQAMRMFRLVLEEHLHLCSVRRAIEDQAHRYLENDPDYQRLRTIPGIGPIIALTILAEAGDLRRFSHYRKFLKYCGFNLSTQQSGQFRGQSRLSKQGNCRLRYAFWIAAIVAIRLHENTFRRKYASYIKADPQNADLKRKAYTAVAVKMARVAYSLIKTDTEYLCYWESSIPGGEIPSMRPLRQS